MSENVQTVELDAELEKIFESLNALPISKAAKLVKAMEARWGVSAAAPAAVMAAAPGAGPAAEEKAEKTSFDVILKAAGDKGGKAYNEALAAGLEDLQGIRKKLGVEVIQTVRGLGYLLTPPSDAR